jgi:hypothetical protein
VSASSQARQPDDVHGGSGGSSFMGASRTVAARSSGNAVDSDEGRTRLINR